jgi:hypothetical protein
MKRETAYLAVGAASLLACATANTESGQGITVRSNSSDTAATVVEAQSGSTVASGKTPLTLRMGTMEGLFRGGKYEITVAKPGFPKRKFSMNFPTVTMGGLIAWIIVDPANGALYQIQGGKNAKNGLIWAPAPGEESFEHVTGYVIATLHDLKGSPQAMKMMKPAGSK